MRPQRTLDLLKDKNFESVVLCGSCGAQEDQYSGEFIDAGYIDELDARVAKPAAVRLRRELAHDGPR